MRALLVLACFVWAGAALAQVPDRAWFGAELADVTKADADALGIEPRGAKVTAIAPGSPAASA